MQFSLTARNKVGTLKGNVSNSSSDGLEIAFQGYGVKNAEDGPPIYIELDSDGNPIIYIWSDINQEDWTHRISLAGAKES